MNSRKLAQKQRQELKNLNPEVLSRTELVEYIIRFGTLAPSTHNTQPWLVEVKNDEIKVTPDLEKQIIVADPTNRDLYISVGAFIKNILLTCEALGIKTSLKLGRDSSTISLDFPLKVSVLKPDLLDAILKRQNFRGFFEPNPDFRVAKQSIGEVLDDNQNVKISLYEDKETIEKLAKLTAEGLEMAYAQKPFRTEIAGFINSNLSSKRTGLFGYSLRMNMLISIIIPKVLKKKDLGPKLAKLNYSSFLSSPGVIVLSAPDNHKSWLSTGLALEEILVRLTQEDIFSSIYVASIEIGDLRDSVAKIVESSEGCLPQLVFCIGKVSDTLPYTVRKDLKEILKD